MTRIFLFSVVLALLPCLASGKRVAPLKVESVIHDGIRYVAPNDDGRRVYVEARNGQTNKTLWDLSVFINHIDPKLEEDVQWVFIHRLNVRDDTLLVTTERGSTYQIDLKTKAITDSDSPRSPAPTENADPHDMPEVIDRAITNGLLGKNYEISFRVTPFYLRGDFNGDGKADFAALLKQRSTGKVGIAIIDGATDKITILGAGIAIGNGGDDFEWMDSWQVLSKGNAASRADVPKLHGDALLVSKREAASALIYWNGKRYAWLQQGD